MNNDKLQAFLSKLEKETIRTFTLPILDEEITYKKMDVIEASINRSLPNFLASRVLEGMKTSLSGGQLDENIPKPSDEDMKELIVRATEMWKKLVIEPQLNDEQIVSVPAQDRLAWFVYAISESQNMERQGGGVTSADEVGNFPNKRGNKGNAKRSANS